MIVFIKTRITNAEEVAYEWNVGELRWRATLESYVGELRWTIKLF
jgi:hypothetical protein